MPTPLLVFIAVLALVAEIVFTPLGAKPLWMSIVFVLGINIGMAALMYAVAYRFRERPTFLPGIEISTKQGLLVIATMGALSILIGVLFGLVLFPAIWGDTPAVDWSFMTRLWPTFVFIDVINVLFRRWRDAKRNYNPTTTTSN